jgi:hypothetical protein
VLNSSTFGIAVFGDGVPVTSNKIMFSSLYGIWLGTLGITIEGNSITTATVGVEFNFYPSPSISGKSEHQT